MKKLHLFRLLFAAMFVTAATAFTSCSNDDSDDLDIPTLEVAPTELNFDEKGGSQTFTITTTGRWAITGAEEQSEWMGVTPDLTGSGNATITVTVDESSEAHKATLKVTVFTTIFGVEKEVDSKNIEITQTAGGVPPVDEEFYYNDFDKEKAEKAYGSEGTSWPYLDQFDGWQNQTGTGIDNVAYAYDAMSARSNSESNSKYSNYEGSGVNNLFFGNGGSFTIQKIAVSTVNLQLTFGAERYVQDAEDNTFVIADLPVQLSADGSNWSEPISYAFPEGMDTNGKWNLATADFTLPEGTTTLYIRFSTKVASAHRIDDVRLKSGIGGQKIEFSGVTPPQPGEGVVITIPEIIAKLTSEQVVLDAANDRYFEAVVVTDKDGGNVNANNLQVMTPGATTAGNGITLYGSGKYTNPNDENFTFKKGDKVKVTLKAGKARIVNYQGLYEVTGSKDDEWVVIEKTGTAAVSPVQITADKLAEYQGMAVTLSDAKAPATAAVWCESGKYGQHTFTAGGTDFTVFVQSDMPGLVGQSFVANATGSITGYATVYKSNAQICPQTPADVAAFMGEPSTYPAISKVDPASLSFAAAGESKTVTVTTVNTDDTYTIQAASDNTQFVPTVDGNVITVAAAANTTDAAITGTLTVNLMKGAETVDTKTVSMAQAKATSGDVTTIEADFSVLANYPADFPRENANKTAEVKTFTFGGYEYTFAGSTGNGYYMAYIDKEKTQPYIINGKAGAYIELPSVAGKALTRVTLTTRSGASTNVAVGIYDSSNTAVAGGEAVQWSKTTAPLEYTYDLTGTTAGTKYRVYIDKNPTTGKEYNAQFMSIKMEFN